MTSHYRETELSGDDLESRVLDAFMEGLPYVLIKVRILPDGDLDLSVNVGNGISDAETVRNVLIKTMNALPGGKAANT